MVIVIWCKTASLPHTNGSVVFARLHHCGPSSNTWFSEPTRLCIWNAFWSVQPFLHRWQQIVPIIYSGPPLSRTKIAPMHGESGSPANNCFFGPPDSTSQTTFWSVRSIFLFSRLWYSRICSEKWFKLQPINQPILQGSQPWQTDSKTSKTVKKKNMKMILPTIALLKCWFLQFFVCYLLHFTINVMHGLHFFIYVHSFITIFEDVVILQFKK